jgi:C_GCAxxG_C_C family probable redox protein
MSSKEIFVQKGGSFFGQGYNCAQSVLLTMQDFWNERAPLDPKVASAFEGGIGGRGSLCGALTGGIIAISQKYGSSKPYPKERMKANNKALKFYNRFHKEHGSVFCRDIIGYDLTNPTELKKAYDSGIFISKCLHLVEKAIAILIDLSEST